MRRRKVSPSLLMLLMASLVLAVHAVWDHIERRRLVARIDAVLSRGEAVHDSAGPHSPAGAYFSAAAALVTAFPSAQFDAAIDRAATVPGAVQWLPPGSPPIQALLEEGRHPLLLADEAAAREFARLPGSTDFTYRAEGLSRVARLVALRTREYVAEGRGDAAAASAIVGLALRRANRDTPVPMAQTSVGEVLSQAQPGEDALRAWDAALRNAKDPDAVATAIERARGRMIERVWRQTYGPSPTALRTQTLPRPGLLPWVWRPWYSRKIAEDLHAWAEALEVARQTPAARASVVHALETKRLADGPQSMFQRGRWFMGLWPTGAWGALVSAVQRDTLAHDRVSRVALAIERFRRAEGGRLPASLDDLVPRILDALPHDPFTDAPPLYRRTDGGYVVYSVGPNLRDDGGEVSPPPLARGPRGEAHRPDPADVGIVVTR